MGSYSRSEIREPEKTYSGSRIFKNMFKKKLNTNASKVTNSVLRHHAFLEELPVDAEKMLI
jgi:hypothetical protein